MHDQLTFSQSDIEAYAGFWSWFKPEQEQRLNWIEARLGYRNLCAVEAEVWTQKRVKEVEGFDTTPEIRAHMVKHARERGACTPRRVDLTAALKGAVEKTRDAWGKPFLPYKPEPGACGIKLQPQLTVEVSHTQEAYSDDSVVAVPYVVTEGKPADVVVFTRNVNALVWRRNSHNGMAGSGCTYSASVHPGFVLVYCRASIAD